MTMNGSVIYDVMKIIDIFIIFNFYLFSCDFYELLGQKIH
jgi:hypothetical protein